jgi:hypothetical protein
MAAGDTLFILWAREGVPTGTVGAAHAVIADGSTPTIGTSVLAYDGGAADEHADWHIVLPASYAGTTGFTWKIEYAAGGTANKELQWEIRALKLTDNSSDLNGADLGMDTQTATTIVDTPAATLGIFNITATATMAKANAGTPAAGDTIIVRVSRNYDHNGGAGANTDDAHFICAICTET